MLAAGLIRSDRKRTWLSLARATTLVDTPSLLVQTSCERTPATAADYFNL